MERGEGIGTTFESSATGGFFLEKMLLKIAPCIKDASRQIRTRKMMQTFEEEGVKDEEEGEKDEGEESFDDGDNGTNTWFSFSFSISFFSFPLFAFFSFPFFAFFSLKGREGESDDDDETIFLVVDGDGKDGESDDGNDEDGANGKDDDGVIFSFIILPISFLLLLTLFLLFLSFKIS